jgi:DNA-binding IscR family transcriptional regulator
VFGERFCRRHSGTEEVCMRADECTLRCLWRTIQNFLNELLGKTSLRDLMDDEDVLLAKIDERTRLIFSGVEMHTTGNPSAYIS